MPLILRRVEQQIPHNHAVQTHDITKYVHPTRLRPGDKPVPLADISDRQLADLAYAFPDEYLEPCRERGLTPAVPFVEEDESLPDLDESKPLPPRVVRSARAPSPGLRAVPVEAEDEDADEPDDEEEEEDTGEGEGEGAAEEDDEDDEALASISLDAAQREFLTLNARNAIGFIEQNAERREFLGKCYQAEKARLEGPRKTVLAAFTSAGIGAED
jgi:hypothetical protein